MIRVVEVCPECGADIEYTILTSNPPIHVKKCTKCDWQWRDDRESVEVIRVPAVQTKRVSFETGMTYNCCRDCANHPNNGGNGNCNCTLPYMGIVTGC